LKININSIYFDLISNDNIIYYIPPFSKVEKKLAIRAIRRGYLNTISIYLFNAFLFEQLEIYKEFNIPFEFYIYPNYANINYYDIIINNIGNIDSIFYKLSEEGEFFSIRPYYLDDVKKIAWKHWAKTSKLVAKQKAIYETKYTFFIINNYRLSEEFVEKLNSFFKYLLTNDIKFKILDLKTFLEKEDNFIEINSLRKKLIYLAKISSFENSFNYTLLKDKLLKLENYILISDKNNSIKIDKEIKI
jgi:hypothetical protein